MAYAYDDVSVPGTTTFSVRDRLAPEVRAYEARGRAGAPVRLTYEAWDDSRLSSERIAIWQKRRLIETLGMPFKTRYYRDAITVRWRVPARVRGALRYCVAAVDRAGNDSGAACATVHLS